MEIFDRYLNFIRILLPRSKQQDIIAELSEDLRGQIADQEAELGRPLTQAELEAVLGQRPLAYCPVGLGGLGVSVWH